MEIFFQGNGDWYIKTSTGDTPITSKAYDCDRKYSITFRHCLKFSGIFKLPDKTEEIYSCSKSKKILKKSLRILLPSRHSNSSFLKMVDNGMLSEEDYDRCYFVIQTSVYSHGKRAMPVDFDIKILKNKEKLTEDTPLNITHNHNKSNKLVALNQASQKFWTNADQNDKSTWPDKNDIVFWLRKHGFSDSLADKGATIIRPEWAGSGRLPKE